MDCVCFVWAINVGAHNLVSSPQKPNALLTLESPHKMALMVKASFFSLIALCFTLANAARFDITNHCPYTVWPAALPGGGRRLDPGAAWALDLGAGSSGRIWGRTGCNFDSSGRGS